MKNKIHILNLHMINNYKFKILQIKSILNIYQLKKYIYAFKIINLKIFKIINLILFKILRTKNFF